MSTSSAPQGMPRWPAALLALLLCACTAPAPPPATPLHLGADLWPGYFPAVIAERKGLMAEQGVALQVSTVSDTSALIADFAAGRYDLIAVSLGDAITLSSSRPDVMVLLVANESSGGDMLLRMPGPAFDDTGSAAPLRLGTTLGGFGELFFRAWLERMRIDPSRVAWTNIDASDVSTALIEGRIDVGHTWKPYPAEAMAAGAVPVFTSKETPGLILDVVLTTRATLARKPEALRGFTRAWLEAAGRWQADRPSGDALVVEALGLAPEAVSLEGIALYTLADNRRVMAGAAEAPLASLIRRYSDFFIERGSLSRPPIPEAMFDPALLPEHPTPP